MRYIFLIFSIFLSILNAGITTIENSDAEAISGNSCVTKSFDMPSSAIITNITMEVNVTYSSRGDLDVTLTSPSGTDVDLTSGNGGSNNNLYTIFTIDANRSIVDDNDDQTITVKRKPEEALSKFNGEDAKGTWSLKICNNPQFFFSFSDANYNYAKLSIDDTVVPLSSVLQVNFQMDECYWLGGANGVTDDVKDSSQNILDAQSRNNADNTNSNFKICRGGDFNNTYDDQNKSDAVFYPNDTDDEKDIGKNAPFSVSAWLYRHDGGDKWMAAVIKVSNDKWNDGWGLEHSKDSGDKIDFFVNGYDNYARTTLPIDQWTHIVGTYDGSTIRIYKNGVLEDSKKQSSYSSGALSMSIGDDISGSDIDDRWQGNIDEVKVWHHILSDSEIKDIYNNEKDGKNFDGTTRVCKKCNGSSIDGGTWDLIGIPADDRNISLSVDDVFGDDMNGTFGDDWRIYKRTYSTNDNSSEYKSLELSDKLEFGQGYWLGSKLDSKWYVDGTQEVDYNSTSSDCTSNSGCVEVNLTPVTHNFDVDGSDGTGPYRYNMVGHISIQKPVKWADCRFIIDGKAYTPSDANASGYANKQIWIYNGTGTNKSNSYNTCDDTMNCKLIPFKGFWVELQGKTKDKTVKLLIPKD